MGSIRDTPTAVEVAGAVGAARDALSQLRSVLYQVPSGELQAMLGGLCDLSAWVDAARVAVVAEAWSRGVVEATAHGTASTAAAVEWIQDSGPVGGEQFSRGVAGDALPVDRATAARLARLAQAAQVGTRQCLVDAVTSARVGLVAGVVALAEYERLAPRLAERVTQEALGWFVQVARSNEVAEVRRLRPAIVARYGRDGELEHQQERARACRVFTTPVSMGDGLCEYTLVADSESVAVIEAAIDHLAAPAPTKAEPDLRSCGQRRFDALLAVINRAVAAGTATPGRPRAQVMVTIPIADLVSGVRGAGATLGHPDPGRARIRAGGGSGGSSGDGSSGGGSSGDGSSGGGSSGGGSSGGGSGGGTGGASGGAGGGSACDGGGSACDGGSSACDGGSAGDGAGRAGRAQGGGTLIDPGTVRRLACDADLIPVVLGGSSEPLDVGRTHRLVTSAIRTALWLRDRGCTYPGCATPAAWTDAHHILHWSAGGNSCLDNLTLLCGRHHTAVHKTGAVALIQDGQVQWAIPARRRQCA